MAPVRNTSPSAPEDLLRLAMSDHREAIAQSQAVIQSSSDPYTLSLARQALGIVLRDRGDLRAATAELRTALRLAGACDNPDRVADVRATLGSTLIFDGKTASGLALLDAAAASSRGEMLAKVLMRRSIMLSFLGRHEPALKDMGQALAGIRRTGDQVWLARAYNNRCFIELALGEFDRAEKDVIEAERLFRESGQELEAMHVLHNRAAIAYSRGDLPLALSRYDEAAAGYAALGITWPDLAIDRCLTLLAAGLATEAVEVVSDALAAESLQPSKRAELLLTQATAALAAADPSTALATAKQARRLFHSQERDWWELRSEFVVARARYATGAGGQSLVVATASIGDRLEKTHAEEAPQALLLAGRLAARHDLDSAASLLDRAANYRRSNRSALVRATGWLAQALRNEMAGQTRGLFAACSCGLDALDEHQMTLGSSELRALATLHGEELARLALRQSLTRSPRTMLRWSERWRATALKHTSVLPPREPKVAAEFAAMRDCVRRLEAARASQAPTAALEQERERLERAVRQQRLVTSGDGQRAEQLKLDHLLGELGGSGERGANTLVEIVEVDQTLYALVAHHNRVRRYAVGPTEAALRAIELARFVLRRAARGQAVELASVGEQLQATLLGDAANHLGDGPVVVAPPSRLHSAPWGLLPALAARPVSAVPSAAMWLRAKAKPAPETSRIVLISGPDLASGGVEVEELAKAHPEAVVLRDQAAKVESCLRALDGASFAHIAAHGVYRKDSPMFSCLVLDDGPLTVHDFERLREAPHRMVLSACDSAVMAPVGADELLGLASTLFSLGTAAIVSSVTIVNDQATGELMGDVIKNLPSADSAAEVLLDARQAARGDSLLEATAGAFVALGV